MHATNTTPKNHRARWAAIGAAVAVSLGAGGLGIARAATNPAGASAYNPISPCRLVDTRVGDNHVGTQNGPLGPDGVMTVVGRGDAITDDSTCDGKIPATATGLQLNVTASEATQATFLTVYPTGETRPTASNVNVADANSTPNSATVLLSTDGKFDVFNRFGNVQVIIDVAGYYADHTHDHLNITDEPGISFNSSSAAVLLDNADTKTIVSTPIRVPADGWVKVDVVGNSWGTTNDRDYAQCQITKNATTINDSQQKLSITDHNADPLSIIPLLSGFATSRVFEVQRADNPLLFTAGQQFAFLCKRISGAPSIVDAHITVTYFSTEYEPSGLVINLNEDPNQG